MIRDIGFESMFAIILSLSVVFINININLIKLLKLEQADLFIILLTKGFNISLQKYE